jgi:hypothetical protein
LAPAADRVVFRAPSGAAYPVAARWTEVSGERRVEVDLTAEDVAALDRDGLFHLVQAARPAGLTLDRSVPATLQLRPGSGLLPDLPGAGASERDPDTASVTSWFAEDPDRGRTDAWFVTGVAQPAARPPAEASTLWAYLDPPGADDESGPVPAAQAALAFLRAEHPDLTDEADGVGRLLDLLGPPAAPDPGDALARLAALLTDTGAEPALLEDGSGLRFAMRGESGSWPCLAQASASGALILYAIHPATVPAEHLADAYVAIGAWNSDQLIGSLDLDPDSGRVVLRIPLLLDGAPPSPALLRRTLDATVDAMDDARPLLESLTGSG